MQVKILQPLATITNIFDLYKDEEDKLFSDEELGGQLLKTEQQDKGIIKRDLNNTPFHTWVLCNYYVYNSATEEPRHDKKREDRIGPMGVCSMYLNGRAEMKNKERKVFSWPWSCLIWSTFRLKHNAVQLGKLGKHVPCIGETESLPRWWK